MSRDENEGRKKVTPVKFMMDIMDIYKTSTENSFVKHNCFLDSANVLENIVFGQTA